MTTHLIGVILLAFLAAVLYLVYRVIHQYTYWRLRRVPTVDFAPIIGQIYDFARGRVSMFDHCKNINFLIPEAKYYGLADINRPVLLVRDPEVIREICIKAFDSFPDHRRFFTEDADPVLGGNLLGLTGQKWKTMRAKLSPCFTAAKMKLMFGLIDDCAREFLHHLHEGQIDAKAVFGRYTCDVIATAAFGLKINSMKDPDNEFLKAGTEAANFSAAKLFKVQDFDMEHVGRIYEIIFAFFNVNHIS